MDSIPTGLKQPEEYAAMISADSQGNGQIAAQILASCVDKGGSIGLVSFGVDYFSTNERTKGVREWMQKNRPDIKMKQVDFTDPAKVSQIAGDFFTANPDVKGVYAVCDQPALDTLSSMRAQGINIPVTTVDLGLQSAIEIAKGEPLKATGSQRPYDQGAAEAMAMMNALIGKETPAWVGVQSLPVVQSNVLESYKTVFKKDPPAELTDACARSQAELRLTAAGVSSSLGGGDADDLSSLTLAPLGPAHERPLFAHSGRRPESTREPGIRVRDGGRRGG
jgi:ribose transport system substrate-binding protein